MKKKTYVLPTALYNATQVRELDRRAIQEFGISGATLMAHAGTAVFLALRQYWPQIQRFVVVCGVGNNAGDGYVVARLAKKAKYQVRVIQVGNVERLSGDALGAYQAMLASGISPTPFVAGCLQDEPLIVDALLGTGLVGEVRHSFQIAISAMNDSDVPVLAVDIPSGLCSDTGQPLGIAVRATLTLSFIGLKFGLFTGAGPAYTGRVLFDDLHLPPAVYVSVPPLAQRLDWQNLARRWLPPRQRTAHKGDFGHVLVIGGAPGYAGAGRLAAEAAARVGAGLISLATHPDHAAQIAVTLPEIMVHAVRDGDELALLLARATVVVLGPGLSRSAWALSLWDMALGTNLPMVLDADALNLLAARMATDVQPLMHDHWIFTPHPGEAARLLGCTTAVVQANRHLALTTLRQRYGGVWILKGAGTLVGDPELAIGLCPVANPGMASGGMGDVLAGLLGGLLAQNIPPSAAACLGVSLHAEAALRCAADGERGMLAHDLMPYLRTLVNTESYCING